MELTLVRRGALVLALTLMTLLSTLACGLAGAPAGAAASTRRPWPFRTLQLGLTSSPGQAIELRRAVRQIGFRYQYVGGGVNTSDNWQGWGPRFVATYIAESRAAGIDPVFSWYDIRDSLPGANEGEAAGDLENINDVTTMHAYYLDLIAFFRQAAGARIPVVMQIEPDLWGHIEQATRGQNAATVPAAVASTGIRALRRLPNNASGLARAFLALRDIYAPRVIVAYQDSIWGTTMDVQASHPNDAQVRWMARRSVAFYRSLHAHFDAIFTETTDRDAAYPTKLNPGTTAWWKPIDFVHLGEYIGLVHAALRLPVVLWQLPVGNTLRAVENNTPYHYRDNTVQSLLGSSASAGSLLRAYAANGVAALLFGGGQQTDTIAGADDGGYFYAQARRYYRLGALVWR